MSREIINRKKMMEQLELLQPKKSQSEEYKATYEATLNFVLDKSIEDASSYTCIPVDELPASLSYTVVLMASNLIGGYGLVNDEAMNEADGVKSITEGDTSVTYLDRGTRLAQAMAVSSLSSDFIGALNRERRVVF